MPRGATRFELILLFGRLKLDNEKMKDWLKASDLIYNPWVVDKYYRYYLEAEKRMNEMLIHVSG